MYWNRIKTIELFLGILLIGGCAGKTDFTQGVSVEDKKLLSSYEDKLLYLFGEIRITKNGFYPNYKIPIHPVLNGIDDSAFYNSKYTSKVASYLDAKKFNLKLFIEDIKKNSLNEFRVKLLKVKAKYPKKLFDTAFIRDEKELDLLLSSNSDEKEIKKILSKMAQNISIKNSCPTGYYNVHTYKCEYVYPSSSSSSSESSKNYSSSSVGSSVRSSGCRIQTVYVPGGNGRTAQTTVCN